MSETERTTSQETSPALSAPQVMKTQHRSFWPWFLLLGILLLAAGEGYLWYLDQLRGAYLDQTRGAQATQLAVLQAQVADLRELSLKAQPAPDSMTVQADLAQKFAALAAQVNAMQGQVAADHGTLSMLQASSVDLTRLVARITLLNQLESARMALDAGQPLGGIPNAPPALMKFAATPPPTEAQLRLAFPAAARAAEAASISGEPNGSYWSRVLTRLENFITVSEGTHVIIGAPAAGVLDQAATLLNAGDLAGAVAQVKTLSPATQQAMAGWVAQAKDLLAARAAMIAMASQA